MQMSLNLLKTLESEITKIIPFENFTDFTNLFESTLDAACLLETPLITKRVIQNNPWNNYSCQ